MEPLKVVVWDNIGNVLLGMRPWERWTPTQQARLLADDPQAREHVPSFAELFADQPVELTWLYNPERRAPSFPDLYVENAELLRDAGDPVAVAAAIEEADVLILHKEAVDPAVLRRASGLRLIQHLGQDIRGIPLEVFAEEPLPPDDLLYDLHDDLANNLILTPHCSSLAPASWIRDSQAVWYNVHRLLRGEAVRWLVE
jgi:phosphoglycerate dehydrogenase-like enzyme